MAARTTMVKVGLWEVLTPGTKYKYRVCTTARTNRDWTIYKTIREGAPKWEFAETGFKSKESAVEYVEELAAKENFNPVADHLNNIDDGVDLNAEGGY